MDTTLLKELRQSAKDKIYIYPFDKRGKNVFIVDKSRYEEARYYGKLERRDDKPILDNLTYFPVASKVRIPMTVEDALIVLKKLRHEFIVNTAEVMRWSRRNDELGAIPLRLKLEMRKY